jgi:2-polyprenyl-3-methyl-5-hydroxy-6-metoxy-1,4-benzoquinol methylase
MPFEPSTPQSLDSSSAVDAGTACRRVEAVLSDWRGREGVAVFGAGAHTRKVLPALLKHKERVAGVADDSPARWGQAVGPWVVQKPAALLRGRARGVLVSSDTQQATLAARIRNEFGADHSILLLYPEQDYDDGSPQLTFTGERQTGRTLDEIELGHRARYYWALQHLPAGAKVLDAACGNGYGAAILAAGGASVLGLDISADAVAFARRHFATPGARVRFEACRIDDGAALHRVAADAPPFDAVVSMETLEHLEHPERFIADAHALLVPGGLLLCSTPNADAMELDEAPFHRRHFSANEMCDMLTSAGFAGVEWFGQEGLQILPSRCLPTQRYCLYRACGP